MKYFIYFFTSILIIGCSGDDDVVTNPDLNSSGLGGEWNLINVSGGFIGINENLDKGIIIWNFNETNKNVVITNNNMNDAINDILPTGTYNFSMVTINGNEELIINDRNLGNFELTNNEFTIDEQFRDGFRYTFQR
ncbi:MULTISPECIES: hypothetical protein [Aquimarina]|uniref:Lipocalin-like domain-containing protein n=1 Tax=Aquimarina algiphila TaxID=2047982 RepID=A0A554VS49_9FLAO|nr:MULTISPECIES: hypothetical protein [Aquimarina]TSE11482.1 hypothetical protein FOF46_00425 [Aquimarina algiphila]